MNQSTEKAEKKFYESPTITVLGDIEAITLAFLNGEHLDGYYPAGKPLSDGILS